MGKRWLDPDLGLLVSAATAIVAAAWLYRPASTFVPAPPPVICGTFHLFTVDLVASPGPRAEDLQRAKSRYGGLLQSCQLNAVRTNPNLADHLRVEVTLTILASGAVDNVAALGPDPTLDRCVEARVSRWTFKPTSSDVTTTLSLVFTR